MSSRSSFGSQKLDVWTNPACNRSYLTAAVRAGVIALVLLGILALLLWL